MRAFMSGLAMVAACLAFTGQAEALIVDGGFEATGFETTTVPAPWAHAGTNGTFAINSPEQFEGDFFARLGFSATFDGGQSSVLSQSFTVASPGSFELAYALQNIETFCACDDVPLALAVSIDGDVLDAVVPDTSAISGFRAENWVSRTVSTTLGAGAHTLAFSFSRGNSTFGRNPRLGIDGVTLTGTSTDIPAPAPAALLALPLIALFALRRRAASAREFGECREECRDA